MAQHTFSPSGLENWRRSLCAHVESGAVPGVAAAIALEDGPGARVEIATCGATRVAGGEPITAQSVFRVASLTKVVVAVAAMMLLERGSLNLDDEVDRWLPELAQPRVLRSLDAQLDDTVPAGRAITVRDVLTYRMGTGSIMAMPGTYPIQTAIAELKIGGDGPPMPTEFLPQDQWLHNLGSLPLLAQPGEKWFYHVSGDVLGALISRVTGQPLSVFLEQNIFRPLGMQDTGFQVRQDQILRLTECVYGDETTGTLQVFDGVAGSAWIQPPTFESGGGGLVSTLQDFLAFAKMLLARGAGPQGPILSPASVDSMAQDHLSAENRGGAEIFFGQSGSWGLGVGVDIEADKGYRHPGRFGWDGGFGTSAYIDPVNGLAGVLLTQRMMDSPEPPRVFTDFWTGAYAALV